MPLSTSDTTPPAEVANFTATTLSSSIINLSWKNPADDDLYQVEITAIPAHGSLKTAVCLAAEKGKDAIYTADGLSADTEYTFTVKTVDKSLNKSAGLSKTARTQTASVPGAPMVITLTQSPATPTNGAVTVTVSSSTSVKTAKWAAGIKTVDEVLASGTAISGGSFTVSDNGTYTVAVMDNDGRREIKTITVNNIDKTPPAKVQNLSAVYASASQKIIVTWMNPSNADFAGCVLRWKKGAESETEVQLPKTEARYEITGISPDSSVYAISVTTKDELGNESEKESVTVRSTLNAEVTAVSLDRTHLDTIMTNRSIAVTVTGSNFNTLSSLLVQVTDGHIATTSVTAVIDAAHNTATATVTAPVPASPTEEGTVYTVKAIVNGTPAQTTANFIVSKPAAVKEIILSPAQIKFGSAQSVSVRVKGANFDIRGETKIKLLNSAGQEVSASTVTVAPSAGTASEFIASVPLPSESGVFTVTVYFDGKKDTKTADVQLYDDPVITKIAIPRAGISYAGNKIPVTIVGKNFKAPGISAADFSGTGLTNFKVISDTRATAEVSCPYTAGEHAVTVNCKTASQTGTLSVKDYTLWTPGKIVRADNTLADKDSFTLTASNPPVAVVFGTNVYGGAIGIALHKSTAFLQWAKENTTGYNTKFEGIICTPSVTGSGAAATATFTGDKDGSDNWDYICAVDPEGTAAAAENYPAFDWVTKYNTAYASQLGAARPAWYMPSIAELCELYKNRVAVNASLLKINGLDGTYADSNLGTDSFRSSSQYSDYNNNAWLAEFGSGYLGSFSKDNNFNVCCIAAF
nr:fibronectin type III domain-containing protein [Treponema socranskii]